MSGRPAHPAASLFPELDSEKLGELAADIAERGLLLPVVLDGDGRVLDGRNRLRACEIVGVEPTFATYQGDDPVGFVVSVNLHRRHLTPSQRVDVTLRLREEGWSLRRIAGAEGVSVSTVHEDLSRCSESNTSTSPERSNGKDGKSYPARRQEIKLEQIFDDESNAAIARRHLESRWAKAMAEVAAIPVKFDPEEILAITDSAHRAGFRMALHFLNQWAARIEALENGGRIRVVKKESP